MNIVLINSEYPSKTTVDHGGIATYTYTMANALAALQHTVYVLVRKGTVTDSLLQSVNVKYFEYQPLSFARRLLNLFSPGPHAYEIGYSFSIRNIVYSLHRKSAIDIVEIPEYNGLAYEFQKFPIPVVIHFHMPTEIVDFLNQVVVTRTRKKWYAFEASAIKNGMGYRAPSLAMKQKASELYKIPQDKITHIRQPIDTSPINCIPRKEKETTKIHILFSGRLECRKGAEFITRTIKKILNCNPKIHFTFAGESYLKETINYREAIENSLNSKERGRVWFVGALPRNDLILLYLRSHIFLCPSLFENAPYSLLEAMAAKLPILAANVAGINELIRHNENGLLFDLDNNDDIIDKLKLLIENREFALKLGQNAYETVTTHHCPASIANKTIEFYNSIINRKINLKGR